MSDLKNILEDIKKKIPLHGKEAIKYRIITGKIDESIDKFLLDAYKKAKNVEDYYESKQEKDVEKNIDKNETTIKIPSHVQKSYFDKDLTLNKYFDEIVLFFVMLVNEGYKVKRDKNFYKDDVEHSFIVETDMFKLFVLSKKYSGRSIAYLTIKR